MTEQEIRKRTNEGGFITPADVRHLLKILDSERATNKDLQARVEKLEEVLQNISEPCPIIDKMSEEHLVKCDADDFLFKSTNRRRQLAVEALAPPESCSEAKPGKL